MSFCVASDIKSFPPTTTLFFRLDAPLSTT